MEFVNYFSQQPSHRLISRYVSLIDFRPLFLIVLQDCNHLIYRLALVNISNELSQVVRLHYGRWRSIRHEAVIPNLTLLDVRLHLINYSNIYLNRHGCAQFLSMVEGGFGRR